MSTSKDQETKVETFKREDLYKLFYHICKHSIDEKVDYFDSFKEEAPTGTNILPLDKFSKALENLMGSCPYLLKSRDMKMLEQFYKSQSSKTKVFIEYTELCKDLDKSKRLFKFIPPMFKHLKDSMEKDGIVLTTYLKKCFKPPLERSQKLPEQLNLDVMTKILSENNFYIEDDKTVTRIIAIISEGQECSSLSTATFKKYYTDTTGDKEIEQRAKADENDTQSVIENKLVVSMRKSIKTWAHLHLIHF